MSSASDVEWQLAEGSRLHWVSWDREYVVFNEGSGDTHFLDSFSAEILKVLEQFPGPEPALIERVADCLDLYPDAGLERRIRDAIQKFREAGLVDPARA
jgi:PqqD family protein of HPr-rel-A system